MDSSRPLTELLVIISSARPRRLESRSNYAGDDQIVDFADVGAIFNVSRQILRFSWIAAEWRGQLKLRYDRSARSGSREDRGSKVFAQGMFAMIGPRASGG